MKIGRNDPCWCGSGKKYKVCHVAFDDKIVSFEAKGAKVPPHSLLKTPEQLEGIRKAGKLNTAVLDMVAEKIAVGMTTEEVNTLVHEYITSHGGIPATLDYCGFPKSCCTSLNDVICHGIPSSDNVLQEGDIVNVDVTTILDGYYADASRMFCMGQVSPEAEKLVRVTKEATDLGLQAIKPWGFLGDIGAAVSRHVYDNGYTVLHDIGGHGVGNDFHEEPYVCHVAEEGTGMLLVPGMVFTVEPMVNAGEEDFYQDEANGWTIYTEDGSLSAQWEYTVAVTDEGFEIITY